MGLMSVNEIYKCILPQLTIYISYGNLFHLIREEDTKFRTSIFILQVLCKNMKFRIRRETSSIISLNHISENQTLFFTFHGNTHCIEHVSSNYLNYPNHTTWLTL